MISVTSFLLSYVLLYKYLAIFVITFLGALVIPVPSGTMLIASSAFSTQGYLSFPLVIIVGILGNIAGDNCGYWLARNYGPKVLYKLGMRRLVDSERARVINREIGNHPILIIYFSRFLTGIAPTVNVVCGLIKFKYRRYLAFEALGEITEVSFFCALGFIFGANWEYLTKSSVSVWVFLLAGGVLTYLVWRYFLKKSNFFG